MSTTSASIAVSTRRGTFRRPIVYECMFCHNAYPSFNDGARPSRDLESFPANLP